MYDLDVTVLKKNMGPASKIPNALRKASERTAPSKDVVVPTGSVVTTFFGAGEIGRAHV